MFEQLKIEPIEYSQSAYVWRSEDDDQYVPGGIVVASVGVITKPMSMLDWWRVNVSCVDDL